LTEGCLRRIEELNPRLQAFITVTADAALAKARRAEREISQGQSRGPLHGIPIALKDIVDTAGVRTTAASGVFLDRLPPQDAEIVRRLDAAGAVILGKLNLHEFAYGGSSVISYFGPVRNPWDLAYSVGGSSGGSAAAVAAGLCYGAIGTDTGGSVRQPAAYCGIVGLKPSYGLVSNRGVIPLAPSMDHVGPMTRTVRDAALLLQAIAGYDAEDPTSEQLAVPDYAEALTARAVPLRLGIPRAFFYDALHPEVESATETALNVLAQLGAQQREIGPLAEDATYASLQRTYSTILTAEAYAYHRDRVGATPELYQPETLRRIRSGERIDPAAYEESHRYLEHMRHGVGRAFDTIDLLITPTAPVPSFRIVDLLADPDTLRSKEIVTLRNTRPFNLLGLPTISIPCGFTGDGLPIGLQITGPHGGDAAVLHLAHVYERATEWHIRHPVVK
jgi:aspartyl-tRNA(Asn)/glutamyl-tRNA(Gln) amidotransferase subunit A